MFDKIPGEKQVCKKQAFITPKLILKYYYVSFTGSDV